MKTWDEQSQNCEHLRLDNEKEQPNRLYSFWNESTQHETARKLKSHYSKPSYIQKLQPIGVVCVNDV